MALPTNYQDYQKRVLSKIQNAPTYDYRVTRNAKKSTLPTLNLPVAKTTGDKAKEAGKNLFLNTLDTIGGFGKTVTHQLANWTDGKATLGDIPLYDQFNMAKKSIGDEFNKGGFHSANAILSAPALALMGIGRDGKGFKDTLGNLGVKNKAALTWGGLAGDLVLDPLNLISGGGAGALKAGLKATKGLNTALAAEHGIEAGKNVYRTLDDLVASGKVKEGSKAYSDIEQRIAELANPARKAMDDSLFAINVPFTNMVKGVGKKPQWMKREFKQIGSENARAVENLLNSVGVADKNIVKKHYGVNNFGELTNDQFEHLNKTVQTLMRNTGDYITDGISSPVMEKGLKVTPPVMKSQAEIMKELGKHFPKKTKGVPKQMSASKGAKFDKFLEKATYDMIKKGYTQPKKVSLDNIINDLPKGENIVARMKKDMNPNHNYPSGSRLLDDHNVPYVNPVKKPHKVERTQTKIGRTSNVQFEKDVRNALTSRKYHLDAGGTSKVGDGLREKLPFLDKFNARHVASSNVLASKAGEYLQDGYTKQSGMRHIIQKHYDKLQNMRKGLSDEELKTVPYIIQNRFPGKKSLDEWASRKGLTSEKVQKLNAIANYMKPVFAQMAKMEGKSGALDNTIKNYFPHMIKKGQDADLAYAAKKYENDPDIGKIIGKSSDLKNNRQRQGAKTLAEVDEKIYGMMKQLDNEKDPDKADALQEKIDILSNMFERNPIDAFAQRFYAGVKSSAMKEIQNNLKKDGLLYSRSGKITENDRITEGLKKLTPEEAKAFGLEGKSNYMHPDVLKSFKQAEEIFTDQGMNKLVDHLVSATNVWRQFVTSYVPVHYLNNFIGNVANNVMAGIKPKSYTDAFSLIRKFGSGKLEGTDEKIFNEAAQRGVLNGFSADFLPKREATNIIDKFNEKFIMNNGYAKFISKHGENSDDLTRLAHFVDVYKKTGSFEKAGESVRKYLFNYNEITKADRLAKVPFPFWNWMKRNIPLQLKGLMSNPKYAAAYHKVITDLQGDDSENLPEFMRNTGLRLPFTNQYVDPRLPIQDLGSLGNLTPMDGIKFLGGSLNPFMKVPMEYWANKQFYNGKPIDYNYAKTGDYDNQKLASYLANQTGIFGKLSKPMFNEDVTITDALRSLFLPNTYSPQQ